MLHWEKSWEILYFFPKKSIENVVDVAELRGEVDLNPRKIKSNGFFRRTISCGTFYASELLRIETWTNCGSDFVVVMTDIDMRGAWCC